MEMKFLKELTYAAVGIFGAGLLYFLLVAPLMAKK